MWSGRAHPSDVLYSDNTLAPDQPRSRNFVSLLTAFSL
jgi:hypothetical protein